MFLGTLSIHSVALPLYSSLTVERNKTLGWSGELRRPGTMSNDTDMTIEHKYNNINNHE